MTIESDHRPPTKVWLYILMYMEPIQDSSPAYLLVVRHQIFEL